MTWLRHYPEAPLYLLAIVLVVFLTYLIYLTFGDGSSEADGDADADQASPIHIVTSHSESSTEDAVTSVAIPEEAQSGDLVIVHMIAESASSLFDTPLGFTELFNTSNTDYAYAIFWKILERDDLRVWDWALSAPDLSSWTATIIRGADPVNPIAGAVAASQFGNSVTHSVDVASADSLLVFLVGTDLSKTGTWSFMPGTEILSWDSSSHLLLGVAAEAARFPRKYSAVGVLDYPSDQDTHGAVVVVASPPSTE